MAKHKRGLGRGLGALLADSPAEEEAAATARADRTKLPIEFLVPNKDQPRKRFDEAALADLALSIKAKGLLQPILVRPVGQDRYEIVAGERRWRAAQRAGLHEAPVVIRDLDDAETAEIALIENIQRTDLNPIEEAKGYQALIGRFGHTQDQIAEAVGKSRSHVANMLRLLKLPDAVCERLVEGALSMGHARAILTAKDPAALAHAVIEQGLSVREAERLAKDAKERAGKPHARAHGESGDAAPARTRKDPDTRALEGEIAEALGLEVVIDHKGRKGGRISIAYADLDQLDEVCRRLLGSGV